MAFWDKTQKQLRSVIEWKNPASDVLLEKWSDNGDEIKNSSKLIVGPGQGCIFVYEGKVEAVYMTEGMVELKTANIPFWTTITKVMQGFQSEHKVGIYFFKMTKFMDQKWGTKTPIKYLDPQYKFPVGLRAFGNYTFQITEPKMIFQEIIGATDFYSVNTIKDTINARLVQPITDTFAEAKFSFIEIDSQRDELAKALIAKVNEEFSVLGFKLSDFRIEGTVFDEETNKRVNRIADMSAEAQAASAAGLNYAQMQQLEAMKEAAKNPNGMAGMGMGVGMGVGFGQQMMNNMGNMNQPAAAAPAADDHMARLKKLKDMFDMGLITQDEFDAKKKEILSAM